MDFFSTSNVPQQGPRWDELECAVFGPGFGECVVLHLGNNEWFIIDSCTYGGSREPIAGEYLRHLSVDMSIAVKRILATHWHDDHIRGISKLVLDCPAASFIMSAALGSREFCQLVYEVDDQNKYVSALSSASELANVFEILAKRGRPAQSPSAFAQDGMRLFQGGFNNEVQVFSLSPSAATIANTLTSITNELTTDPPVRRFRRLSPNHLSVAVQVIAGSFGCLLGADLENTVDNAFGWGGVLTSELRSNSRNQLFKVPHHGSRNAHHDDVWRTMLQDAPISVVAPFSKQKNPLPTDADIARIRKTTNSLHVTTWPLSSRPKKRQGVDGILNGATKTRRSLAAKAGFVRVRLCLSNPQSTPRVELFGSAKSL